MIMKKTLEIGKFPDKNEKGSYKSIESKDFQPVSQLTTKRREELKKIAKATINEERVKTPHGSQKRTLSV